MGRDNERRGMVLMIVHMRHYVISKEPEKKWGCNRHACNIQDDPSVTTRMVDTIISDREKRNTHAMRSPLNLGASGESEFLIKTQSC